MVLGKMGSYLLRLELTAMQQEGKGEIVSSPRVITSDQNKAIIKQGVEIPYQEATSSGATSVSFKEAVLQLEVTPHITPDDRVIMDLKVNKDNPDFTRAVLGVPPVDTRSSRDLGTGRQRRDRGAGRGVRADQVGQRAEGPVLWRHARISAICSSSNQV